MKSKWSIPTRKARVTNADKQHANGALSRVLRQHLREHGLCTLAALEVAGQNMTSEGLCIKGPPVTKTAPKWQSASLKYPKDTIETYFGYVLATLKLVGAVAIDKAGVMVKVKADLMAFDGDRVFPDPTGLPAAPLTPPRPLATLAADLTAPAAGSLPGQKGLFSWAPKD